MTALAAMCMGCPASSPHPNDVEHMVVSDLDLHLVHSTLFFQIFSDFPGTVRTVQGGPHDAVVVLGASVLHVWVQYLATVAVLQDLEIDETSTGNFYRTHVTLA